MSKQQLVSGHDVVAMDEEWLQRRSQYFAPFQHGIISIMPDGWLYPGTVPAYLDRIQNFQFRLDDVWVLTFPKSGTTWMQEILWTMIHNPNLDHPQANEPILTRSIDISIDILLDSVNVEEMNPETLKNAFNQLCPGKNEADGLCVQLAEAQPGRRVIKSHFPLDLMPPNFLDKTKVVYMARNPKDMVVSFYYFCKLVKPFNYKGSLEEFVRMLMKEEIVYGPYWPHVIQAWQQRNHPNLHFILFEDMKADPMAELRRLNHFLDTNLTDEHLNNVAQHTCFSSMKARGNPLPDKSIYNDDEQQNKSGFYRKGIAGDWKNHFSQDLIRDLDEWIQTNNGNSGIPFKWE